ncbi:MAG TPA: VTT domain-containing protein [Acidimicrobiia bacterium]|nr:VTT domain-containing protein [Acidimicrobiia bacterium]
MHYLDPNYLIETFGTIGLILVIYAESGILLGLVFPGDSLLFTAGLLASQHKFGLNIFFIAGGAFAGAVLGAQTGYWLGKRFGPALFQRPDSRVFKQEYVEKSKEYFERYGGKTVVIGRFVPFVRTLVPMVAGIGAMELRAFTVFNVIGAALWAAGVSVAGYFLGKTIPNVDHYLLPIIGVIILVSVIPPALEIRKQRKLAREAQAAAAPAPVAPGVPVEAEAD